MQNSTFAINSFLETGQETWVVESGGDEGEGEDARGDVSGGDAGGVGGRMKGSMESWMKETSHGEWWETKRGWVGYDRYVAFQKIVRQNVVRVFVITRDKGPD